MTKKHNNIEKMAINNTEKQSISIALIDGDQQQQEKEELRPYFHRFKKWCTGKYLINVGAPIVIVIIMIILILLFRVNSRRCGIFYSSYQCQRTHHQSD